MSRISCGAPVPSAVSYTHLDVYKRQSLDNPLRLNDFITYTHSQTVLERNPLRDSAADSFFYSLPLGYWTLQLSSSSSSYRTPVTASVRTLVARGDSDTFRTELNKVAYRCLLYTSRCV